MVSKWPFCPVENNPDKTLISDTMMKVGGDRLFMQKTGKLIRKSSEGRSKVSPGSEFYLAMVKQELFIQELTSQQKMFDS